MLPAGRTLRSALSWAAAYGIHGPLEHCGTCVINYNAVAWKALELQPIPDQALEYARTACSLSGYTNARALHTLASVYAERGELPVARLVLTQTVQARLGHQPAPADWYVVGRMAEHAGLREAARAAYVRVAEGDDSDTRRMAQGRLQELDCSDSP